MCVAKTKMLISCYCTADLRLCFLYRFSHDVAHISLLSLPMLQYLFKLMPSPEKRYEVSARLLSLLCYNI